MTEYNRDIPVRHWALEKGINTLEKVINTTYDKGAYMREEFMDRTRYVRYVVDDGWNPPREIIEMIELRIAEAKDAAMNRVRRLNKKHRGEWLTKEVIHEYAAKALIYRVLSDNQYIGKVRELGRELQEKYGVTEQEAINIVLENKTENYAYKYYKIKNLIPDYVDEQYICDSVREEYMEMQLA